MRNSVLEELRVRRLADIQEEMSCRAVFPLFFIYPKVLGFVNQSELIILNECRISRTICLD